MSRHLIGMCLFQVSGSLSSTARIRMPTCNFSMESALEKQINNRSSHILSLICSLSKLYLQAVKIKMHILDCLHSYERKKKSQQQTMKELADFSFYSKVSIVWLQKRGSSAASPQEYNFFHSDPTTGYICMDGFSFLLWN